jgi:hypothetical protein
VNKHEHRMLLMACIDLKRKLDAQTPSCRTCQHWLFNRCAEFDAPVPDEVRPVGCESWVSDGLPF